jgi:large subunit ribosomal protein L29
MAKTDELREMSDEQIRLTWKDAAEHLFRLRIQAQTEKLDVPSELRRQRRLIARCQTILNERRLAAAPVQEAPPKAAPVKTTPTKATPKKTSPPKTVPVKTTAKAAAAKPAAAKK